MKLFNKSYTFPKELSYKGKVYTLQPREELEIKDKKTKVKR